MKYKIVADSSCDLSNEYIIDDNVGFEIVPLSINIDQNCFIDNDSLNIDEMLLCMKNSKSAAKTSCPSPFFFTNSYEEADYVFVVTISSKLSGTYNSAYLGAIESNNKVHVIDSQNLSSGEGLLVLKACKLRDLGKSADEIISEVQRCVPLVRTSFSVETLEYLHLGGRCSGASKLFGTLLKIKPIIKVVDGKMMVAKKPIGSYKKALDIMLESFVADLDNIDLDNVLVTHCKADSDAVYLIEELKKYVPENCIHETYAESIVSTHCGPRTIGILYILK